MPNQNEQPASENRNTIQPNNTEQIQSQEQKINQENLKRIMNSDYLTIIKNIE